MYFLGCFLGYIIETLLKTFIFHSMNNGILYGPWIPVYGFGLLIINFVVDKMAIIKKSKTKKLVLLFFISLLLLTILEEIGGLMIELIFHKTFWSYKNMPFHVGKYISVEMSVLWSLAALVFTNYIRPFFEIIVKKYQHI